MEEDIVIPLSRKEKTDWSHLPSTGQPGFQSLAFGIESHALLCSLPSQTLAPCACFATVRREMAVGQNQKCTWNAALRLLCDRPTRDCCRAEPEMYLECGPALAWRTATANCASFPPRHRRISLTQVCSTNFLFGSFPGE